MGDQEIMTFENKLSDTQNSSEDNQAYQAVNFMQLCTKFKKIYEAMYIISQDFFETKSKKIKISWLPFLLILSKDGDRDIKSLASRRRVTLAAVSQITKEMLKSGYIDSRLSNNDLRSKIVSLTAKGHKLVEEIKPRIKVLQNRFEDCLENFDRNQFYSLIDCFEEKLDEIKVLNASKLAENENEDLIAEFKKLNIN